MAEIARVLVERDEPITGSAVFLFNGAEGKSFLGQSCLYHGVKAYRFTLATM